MTRQTFVGPNKVPNRNLPAAESVGEGGYEPCSVASVHPDAKINGKRAAVADDGPADSE
jgi:hypothetical protein